MLADITASTFKPGEILSVALDDNNEYTLTLEKVHLANYKGRSGQRDPFTLLFTGSTNFVLPQGMHTVTHGTMGTFPLFLVPVVPQDSGRHYYEACFS